jgi:hypothetical protein
VFAGATGETKIVITNNCPHTVWAGVINPNGGRELGRGESWNLTLPVMEQTGKIWGRTGCNFNEAGLGSCATGDCGGQLQCKVGNAIPVTSVGYQLYGYPVLGYGNTDYYYVSLAEGFNLPMSVGPLTPSTKSKCNPVACKKDINAVCPPELKVNGGCHTGCGAFPSNDLYCCKGDYAQQCPANNYTTFFKSQCPESIGYGFENQQPDIYCPSGTEYKVLFCP